MMKGICYLGNLSTVTELSQCFTPWLATSPTTKHNRNLTFQGLTCRAPLITRVQLENSDRIHKPRLRPSRFPASDNAS
jgi:hypothetical protein